MTVVQSDITFLQSSDTGSAGGAISGIEVVTGVLNSLWPDISPAEAGAGGSRVRKWFMRNDNVAENLANFGLWVATAPTGCTEELGVGFDTADDADALRGTLIALSANALIAVVSNGADTRTVTVVGVNAAGAPMEETVTLNGLVEVLTVVTFSKVYAVRVSALGSQIVTIKQGSGGSTLATIPAGAISTWLWVADAASLASAIKRMAIGPGAIVGFWDRLTWTAGAAEVDPNNSIIGVQRLA